VDPVTSAGITFNGAGLLILGSPTGYTGTLHGLATGDAIQLTGETIASAMITGTTLAVNLVGGGAVDLAVDPGLNGTQLTVTQGTNGDIIQMPLPCFRAGTRILTERGAVAVEHLREGDTVLSLSGLPRRIRWIGHRTIDCRRHPCPEAVRPFRVQAHAFGRGRPTRDLFLSPDHAVFAEGVLIPIKYLDNGTTVRQILARTVSYYHIELVGHDVVFAEGLAAESYLDTGDRTAFANGDAGVQLHPVFGATRIERQLLWDAFGFARLAIAGEEVDRVRRSLRQRARSLAAGERPRNTPDSTARARSA